MKRILQNLIVSALIPILLFGNFQVAVACGPYEPTPVFEYEHAPENPFENFAAGKIGILKPSYHRSVLFAGYRYLSGASFTADEQKALVEVWNADFNNKEFADNDVTEAVKTWLAARKVVVKDEEKLPEIYTERPYNGGYDFFPNCTKSAFEIAAETLKSRAASYGSEDGNVRDWLAAQDVVFTNCASGKTMPAEVASEAADWLEKDRAYQMAAAAFYSLRFPEAKRRFEQIAADNESPWQQTADYLIGRTLVREASLTANLEKRGEIYNQAEIHLQIVVAKNNKFSESARKLLNLIEYRTRPLERAHRLAVGLLFNDSRENLRQNLIDYTWLLDKLEKETLEAEEKRKQPENKSEPEKTPAAQPEKTIFERVQEGEIIHLWLTYQKASKPGAYDSKSVDIAFPPDASDEEIVRQFEEKIARKLTAEEITEAKKLKTEALKQRDEYLAGNFQLQRKKQPEYEGGYYGTEKLTISLVPPILRQDDLTDWLFTYQISGADVYAHALKKWRENDSDLWLVTALAKAEKNSPEINRLVEKAVTIHRNSPAFPTVAFHRARLLIDQNKTLEARKLLDEVLTSDFDFPVSTRNQFLVQRASVAGGFDEFLKYSQRQPFGFCFDFNYCGKIEQIIEREKAHFDNLRNGEQTREEYGKQIEENYKDYLVWENRMLFDEKTVDVFNFQFPLAVWFEAAHNAQLPDYLRRELLLKIWTRAVLLENQEIENKIAPEIVEKYPELETLFKPYLNAKNVTAKRRAALWILLKVRSLSPFLSNSIIAAKPDFEERDVSYNFEMLWWCELADTEYDEASGEQVKKNVTKPAFLTAGQFVAAGKEQEKLKAVGAAPAYFAAKVFEWARLAPLDKRVPEALYIVVQANGWTKFGCGDNEETKNKAAKILKTRYKMSEWTTRLNKEESEN